MNRLKSAALVVLIAGSAAVLAAHAEPAREDPAAMNHEKTAVTVTGCVANGQRIGDLILTGAALVPAATVSATAPAVAPTLDAPASVAAPTSYALEGESLKAHLGHQVEVTGTAWLNDAMHGAKAPTASPEPVTVAAADTTLPPGSTLSVKSVKMISTTCS